MGVLVVAPHAWPCPRQAGVEWWGARTPERAGGLAARPQMKGSLGIGGFLLCTQSLLRRGPQSAFQLWRKPQDAPRPLIHSQDSSLLPAFLPAHCSLPPPHPGLWGLQWGLSIIKCHPVLEAVCAFTAPILASPPLQQRTAPLWRGGQASRAPSHPPHWDRESARLRPSGSFLDGKEGPFQEHKGVRGNTPPKEGPEGAAAAPIP